MDATPIDFGDARPLAGSRHPMGINAPFHDPAVTRIGTWAAVHEAAATVGAIAGVDRAQVHEGIERGRSGRPRAMRGADDQDLHDLADIMQRGIAALLTAHTSGGNPQAAARALWHEFLTARDAMMPNEDRGAA